MSYSTYWSSILKDQQRQHAIEPAMAVLELCQGDVGRLVWTPHISGHVDAIPFLVNFRISGQCFWQWFLRVIRAADARTRFLGTAAAPLVLGKAVVPVDQDCALWRELHETDAQGLEGNLKAFGEVAQDVQVNAPVGNRVAQQVAGDQQVAGEVVRFALNIAHAVSAGINAFLVTAETGPLAAVQHEVAQLMGNRESLALCR